MSSDLANSGASSASLRIAISGYYGCGNTGDEAVLAGILESFKVKLGPGMADFTVLSQDPDDTVKRHKVKSIDRMNLRVINGQLEECDLLLSGGGSLLQDTTSLKSLIYYLWIVSKAQKRAVPVMYYAQGMGPFNRSVSRFLVRRVTRKVQMVTVRDASSLQLLKDMGVSGPPVHLTADPAFALQAASEERVTKQLALAGVPTGQRLIGLALRPWKGTGPSIEEFGSLISGISRSTGAHILLLPMQSPVDVEFAKQLSDRSDVAVTVLDTPISPREMLGIVGRLDGIVAMRLHALIFAAIMSVPSVALAYDPKVTELMRIINQSRFNFPLNGVKMQSITDSMRQALQEGNILTDSLRERAGALREAALQNVDYAMIAAGRMG